MSIYSIKLFSPITYLYETIHKIEGLFDKNEKLVRAHLNLVLKQPRLKLEANAHAKRVIFFKGGWDLSFRVRE